LNRVIKTIHHVIEQAIIIYLMFRMFELYVIILLRNDLALEYLV